MDDQTADRRIRMREQAARAQLARHLARELLNNWYDRWRIDERDMPECYLDESGDRVRLIVVGPWVTPEVEPYAGQRCAP